MSWFWPSPSEASLTPRCCPVGRRRLRASRLDVTTSRPRDSGELGGREWSMAIHGHMWNVYIYMCVCVCIIIWISMECRLFPWYYWYLCGFRTKSYWNLWWYPSLYTYLAIWIMGICISSSSGHRKESITNYINLIKHGYDWNLR